LNGRYHSFENGKITQIPSKEKGDMLEKIMANRIQTAYEHRYVACFSEVIKGEEFYKLYSL
jgi:hypothetical protein